MFNSSEGLSAADAIAIGLGVAADGNGSVRLGIRAAVSPRHHSTSAVIAEIVLADIDRVGSREDGDSPLLEWTLSSEGIARLQLSSSPPFFAAGNYRCCK